MESKFINPEEEDEDAGTPKDVELEVPIKVLPKRVPRAASLKVSENRGQVIISTEERDVLVKSGIDNYHLLYDKDKSIRDIGYKTIQTAVQAVHGTRYDLDKIKCKWSHMRTDAPRENRRLKRVHPHFAHMRIHPKLNTSLTMILEGVPEYQAMDNFDGTIWRESRSMRKRKSEEDLEYEIDGETNESFEGLFDQSESSTSPKVVLDKLESKKNGTESVITVKPGPDTAKPPASVLKERFAKIRKQQAESARSLLGGSITPSTSNPAREANILSRERNILIGQQNCYLREISESLKLIASNL